MKIEQYIGETKGKKQYLYLVILEMLVILYTGGLWYVRWNATVGGWIMNVIAIILAAFFVINFPKGRKYHFKNDVLLLILLPFISSINTNLIYGQSYIESVRVLLLNFVWVFYFVFHRYKVKESTILKSFFIISLFIVAIQIIQQFTYPNAYFGVASHEQMIERGLEDAADQRNGLWRFRIGANAYFTAPILFGCFEWLRKKSNFKLVSIIILLLISVYLTLTRQVIAACLLTIFVSFFLGKKNRSTIKILIFGAILFAIIYSYSDILFGNFALQTSDEMNEDNIRMLAATYFGQESLSSVPIFLFGHGAVGKTGSYADLMYQLNNYMHFYTSDVGFIGTTYIYGAVYVFMCYRLLWKLFFVNKTSTPLYIRMFAMFTGLMSIMIFPMSSYLNFFIWSMMLYIADIHINKSKEEEGKLSAI